MRLQLDMTEEDFQSLKQLREQKNFSTAEAVKHSLEVYDWLHEHRDETIEVSSKDGQVQRFPIRLLL